MAKRTKKVGIVGKYGTRYSVSLRKQMEVSQHNKYFCKFCGKYAVKRKAVDVLNQERFEVDIKELPEQIDTSTYSNSTTNRLITSKDHASMQINLGHLDERGIYTGAFSTFAL
ncbi:hypothetical protein ACS0TY_015798 [Phlomoides rotata]